MSQQRSSIAEDTPRSTASAQRYDSGDPAPRATRTVCRLGATLARLSVTRHGLRFPADRGAPPRTTAHFSCGGASPNTCEGIGFFNALPAVRRRRKAVRKDGREAGAVLGTYAQVWRHTLTVALLLCTRGSIHAGTRRYT